MELHSQTQKLENNSRRNFLKKTLYATPSMIVMGTIVKPTKANADGFGAAPSDPNTDSTEFDPD